MNNVGQPNANTATLNEGSKAAPSQLTCSVSGGVSRLHRTNHSLPEQHRGIDALKHFGSLLYLADPTRLFAGAADLVDTP